MGLYNVGSTQAAITKATGWSGINYTSTVAIAEAAAADASVIRGVIENRGSVDIYFAFGGSAPASTAAMLKLPPNYGWLEESPSAAHLKIWVGGGVSSVVIARWTA